MTSPISSYSQSSGLPDPIGSAAGAPAASPPGASSSRAGAAAASGEAVTLTPDLLEAARSAPGVDYQAVQSLKAEIASGTYQVPSENLAASIVAAFAETRS
jgi:flagellar biosynthesis anti-sigma factor FlgM